MIKYTLRKLFKYNERIIKNDGLELALEFGKNWLQPIEARLSKIYPHLSQSKLDSYNQICREALFKGHKIVYKLAEQQGKETSYKSFAKQFSTEYPWVNTKNLKRIFSQGMYYAYKDLGF